MNSRKNQKTEVKPIVYLLALVMAALVFGSIKIYFDNERNLIGREMLAVERRIVELNDLNQELATQITNLKTRQALEQKALAGLIHLQPIAENAVRRVGGQNVASNSNAGTRLLQAAR